MIKIIKTLRSIDTHKNFEKYSQSKEYPKCYMCESRPIKEYKHWKIVENEFPYDGVASTSHILTTKNHITEEGISIEAIKEYKEIKRHINEEYDIIVENTYKLKSIPDHHHTHLLILKERKVEIENLINLDFLKTKQILKAN